MSYILYCFILRNFICDICWFLFNIINKLWIFNINNYFLCLLSYFLYLFITFNFIYNSNYTIFYWIITILYFSLKFVRFNILKNLITSFSYLVISIWNSTFNHIPVHYNKFLFLIKLIIKRIKLIDLIKTSGFCFLKLI